jgi:hypothetical protein
MNILNSFASSPGFKYFDKDANPDIDPKNLTIRSGKSINCKCPKCNHTFPSTPHALYNRNCKYCTHQSLCIDINCEMCFNNSLASKLFNTIQDFKNKIYKPKVHCYDFNHIQDNPRFITKGCSKKLQFICYKCNHSFPSQASRILGLICCSYCSKTPNLLCHKDNNCKLCFNKSFASHPKAQYWDYSNGKNEGKNPHDVFKSGGFYADFICDDCGHEINISCNNVSTGYWCAYCSGQKRCDEVSCEMCTTRKLSSHPMAMYWNLELNPKDISPDKLSLGNCREKFYFDCPNNVGHPPFKMTPSHINRGQLCPSCLRKTQAIVSQFLNEEKIVYKTEYSPLFLRNKYIKNSFKRYDWLLTVLQLILELDGLQHFEKRGNWGDPIETMNTDIDKMLKAIENGYSGIRLFQPDVFTNKFNWKEWLLNAIEIIKSSSTPIWIFPNNKIYDGHIKLCVLKNIPYIIL